MEDVERRAAALGLMALRWPEPFPADTEWAMLAATYAKQIGRGVAFSLAAFRQAFAAGRDLSERDSVLIAAAAARCTRPRWSRGRTCAAPARRWRATRSARGPTASARCRRWSSAAACSRASARSRREGQPRLRAAEEPPARRDRRDRHRRGGAVLGHAPERHRQAGPRPARRPRRAGRGRVPRQVAPLRSALAG